MEISAGQTSYAYDLLNRATKINQSGNGVQSKRVDMIYNKVNQMTSLARFNDVGGINLVAETSYTYDMMLMAIGSMLDIRQELTISF